MRGNVFICGDVADDYERELMEERAEGVNAVNNQEDPNT